MKLAAEAVLVSVSTGAFTGVGPAVLVQCAAAGQVGSPPPDTVAVLVTLGSVSYTHLDVYKRQSPPYKKAVWSRCASAVPNAEPS